MFGAPAPQPSGAQANRPRWLGPVGRCLLVGSLAPLLAWGCEDPAAPPMGQPVEGAWISDTFGARPVHPVLGVRGAKHHDGVDFAIRQGAPFKATMAGEVFEAGMKPGYGLAVFIRHQDGYETRYAHAFQLLVKSGQRVAAGQVLGQVGRSGTANGPHLHYELRQNGKPIDPLPFLARSQDGPSPLPSPSPRPSRFVWPSPQAAAMPPRGPGARPSPRLAPGARPVGRPAGRPAGGIRPGATNLPRPSGTNAARRVGAGSQATPARQLTGSPRPGSPMHAPRPRPPARPDRAARPAKPPLAKASPRPASHLPAAARAALNASRAAAAAARLRAKATPGASGPAPAPKP